MSRCYTKHVDCVSSCSECGEKPVNGRKINIGQKVICRESGVIGTVLRFYNPTACEEQTLVLTKDCGEYHAPTRTWSPYLDGLTPSLVVCDEFATFSKNLNPHEEYVMKFTKNHGLSISEAFEHPMCKARLHYFNMTGK